MGGLDRKFGVSTHLFHEKRLTRDHLVHVAGHGFEAVEVFATRSHFDYRDPQAIRSLKEWLTDTGLELHSVHAPIGEAFTGGKIVGSFSNASADEARRRRAVDQATAALEIAAVVPFRRLVLHLGAAPEHAQGDRDNQPAAARRSVEEIAALAWSVHVQVAIEVIPNPLSSPAALCRLVEEELEGVDVGICLDYGHANLGGDVVEAIETVSGHMMATHVHDNGGRRDDHLVPFAGRIDWDTAMMATQKVGYDGVLMFEVADGGDALAVLKKAAAARERLQKLFVTF
jgi:sugar phosphate isomerase/epimerase